MKVDFVIAGAAKSGSSTLYNALKKHSMIGMCNEKEPAYFSHNYDMGDEWYHSLFNNNGAEIFGEATVECMVDAASPERILSYNSSMKLIFILRDPVKRAWSHYLHRVKMGEEVRTPEEAIHGGLNQEYFVRYSKYIDSLNRIKDFFPEEQLLVLTTNELQHDEKACVGKVFRFLGMPDEDILLSSKERNVAMKPRFRALSRFGYLIRGLRLHKYPIPPFIYNFTRKAYRHVLSKNMIAMEGGAIPNSWVVKLKPLFEAEYNYLNSLDHKT